MREAPLSLLLVEDSALIRASLSEAVEALGAYSVAGTADSASAAQQLLQQRHFDAVIVDLQLRSGSGFDVLAFLQQHPQLAPMFSVVLTNHARAEYRDRCNRLGATHFFDKSLEFDRVLEALSNFAAQRA